MTSTHSPQAAAAAGSRATTATRDHADREDHDEQKRQRAQRDRGGEGQPLEQGLVGIAGRHRALLRGRPVTVPATLALLADQSGGRGGLGPARKIGGGEIAALAPERGQPRGGHERDGDHPGERCARVANPPGSPRSASGPSPVSAHRSRGRDAASSLARRGARSAGTVISADAIARHAASELARSIDGA